MNWKEKAKSLAGFFKIGKVDALRTCYIVNEGEVISFTYKGGDFYFTGPGAVYISALRPEQLEGKP